MQRFIGLSVVLLLAIVLAGCGGKAAEERAVDRAEDEAAEVDEGFPDESIEVESEFSDRTEGTTINEDILPETSVGMELPEEATPPPVGDASPELRIERMGVREDRMDMPDEERPESPRTAEKSTGDSGEEDLGVDPGYVMEKIYYGTDRAPEIDRSDRWATQRGALQRALLMSGIGVLLIVIAVFWPKHRLITGAFAVISLVFAGLSMRNAQLEKQQAELDDRNQNRRYGYTINVVDGKHTLERGICWVSIPTKTHQRGSGVLEAPGLFEVNVDPEKHFQLQQVKLIDREDFLSDFRQSVSDSSSKHAFVFIHGYNVTFRDAALRTAQLKYDLDFDGPAALFSWPSNGKLLSYATDEETVNLTVRSGVLHEFLADLIDETGVESVHLIAHSMGNRALTRAFEKLPNRMNSEGEKVINRLVMAAPDVNPAEFRLLADRIQELTRSRTLYASERDIALIGSEILRGSTYTRLGQGGANRVVIDGVQTIDASDLDQAVFDLGHSYYVHPKVMQDLKILLHSPSVLPDRPWLLHVDNYWTFRPN